MPNPRIASYMRVSTKLQTVDSQRTAIERYLAARDQHVDLEFAETISTRKNDRPEYQRMMAAARRREFNLLVVFRFDRLARSVVELVTLVDDLRKLGIEFVSLNEAVDTSTSAGRAIFSIFAALAEMERDAVSERVKAGLRHRQSKGEPIGRPPLFTIAEVQQAVSEHGGIKPAARALETTCNTIRRYIREAQKTPLSVVLENPPSPVLG